MNITGAAGESFAARYLERIGHEIIALNWRCGAGEIDIVSRIAVDRRFEIVFTEVKTRHSQQWGSPCEAVDWRKQARIRRVAAAFLAEAGHSIVCSDVRFDVVEVLVEGGTARLNHIIDAF